MEDEYFRNEVLFSCSAQCSPKNTETMLSWNAVVARIQAKCLKFQADLFL